MTGKNSAQPAPEHQMDLAAVIQAAMCRYALRTAISFPDGEISYQRLEKDVRELETFLREQNRAHKSVLLFMSQGPALIASVLSCLKGKAVFCPAHLGTPEQRLVKILEELGTNLVFTDPDQVAFLQSIRKKKNLSLDIVCIASTPQGMTLTRCPQINGTVYNKEYDPRVGYVYFSSGSTGTPKGILGRTDGLAHFISWEIRSFGVTSDFVVSQLTPPSFDPFLRDILVPLCVGGRVAIPQPERVSNPRALLKWLRDEKVTLAHMVPSLFRLLLTAVNKQQPLPDLQRLVLAGEMLYGRDVSLFYERMEGKIALTNLYGPTETTLAKFCHNVIPQDEERGRVPVGYPIDGTEACIWGAEGPDEKLMEGELCIKPPFEPLGYLNSELTAQRFVRDSSEERGLWYRSGDLAKRLENGEFELIGRVDSQIKIRGMLVQPEEVEAVLAAHPHISRCAVIALEDPTGQPYLEAELELCPAEAKKGCTVADYKHYLLDRLPDYMVPAFYEIWDKLPLNTNGKIDRQRIYQDRKGREANRIQNAQSVPTDFRERLFHTVEPYLNSVTYETIDFQQELVEYGVDSLSFVTLLLDIEAEFQMEFDESVFQMDILYSLERILQYILDSKGLSIAVGKLQQEEEGCGCPQHT